MLQATLGYIIGQTVVVLAIAAWHLVKRWDCPCRLEAAEIESRYPPQPCQRQSLSLHREAEAGVCQCDPIDREP